MDRTLAGIPTLLILIFGTAAAASLLSGPELHIYSSGELHLIGAEVLTKHAENLIAVQVWGQKWTIPMDQWSKLEDAGGKPIAASDILIGHRLEVRGRPLAATTGWIDARSVRDLSIGTPPASSSFDH